jgi:hypothetical protein
MCCQQRGLQADTAGLRSYLIAGEQRFSLRLWQPGTFPGEEQETTAHVGCLQLFPDNV